ncbi:uncharacterized protein at3g27210 [Phtheirospermum japonicum]|uniref:Uncharacterized protein at3g27210 n=1 Tax=Phtheirospermum japonicum TaxID=374723 RepID=A0A830C4N8_9LAMI|nr:uncharacterized protein at3g27210 [Phtheirospermum japonicum]
MGSCVSVHKNPESAVELRLSVEPAPAVKHESDTVNGGDRAVADLAAKSGLSSRFRSAAGSKDDAFFDSQPWLESDCEDDFMSVNGDFTPSRGSTPVHHKFSSGNPTVDNGPAVVEETLGSVQEPYSNPEKKKRLSELFKESLRHDQSNADEENEANVENEATSPDGVIGAEDEPVMSTQCCLPSFSDRKKKTSPVVMNGY